MLKLDKMPIVTLKNIEDSVKTFNAKGRGADHLAEVFTSNDKLYEITVRSSHYLCGNSDSKRWLGNLYFQWFGALQLALEDRAMKHWTRFEFPRVEVDSISFAKDAVDVRGYHPASDMVSPVQVANETLFSFLKKEGFEEYIVPSIVPQSVEEKNEYLAAFLERESGRGAERFKNPRLHTDVVHWGNVMYRALERQVYVEMVDFRSLLVAHLRKR